MNFDPAIVSSVTALIAVILSPIITIFVTKKQINASVLSNNRQVWINRLRDELAIIVATIHHLPSAHANQSISTDNAIAEYGKFIEKVQVVKLLINPKESDHDNLVKLIESAGNEIINAINSRTADAKKFEEHSQRIVSQAQNVLKREWVRVKEGK